MACRVTRAVVPLQSPLDLQTTLFSGQDFRWEPEGDGYVGWLGDAPVLLRPVRTALEAHSPLPAEETAARLRCYFRLDDDLQAVHRALAEDGPVAQAMRRWQGLRLLRLDAWHALASYICSAQANIPRITRMVHALARHLGEPVHFMERVLWRFPTPHTIAQAGEGVLRALGLGYRAPHLWQTACQIAQGEVDLAALASLPTEDLRQCLRDLPGVGDKVADCVLLLGYGRTEAFPIDVWVRRALREGYSIPPPHTYRRLREWAVQRWGHYAGYAQLYLFHHWRTRRRRG
ncbi:MAG: 8-oxoguanine DNA glycosylase [Dehalococcoidia bacterium]|nr:8-oxoguanine DNA glycosylase [Dehalococcoidia bacterium]MDW8120417.1 DNA glycosylase [Chloroflexota bacterium]